MGKSRGKHHLIKLVRKVVEGKATAEEREFVKRYYDYFDEQAYEQADLSGERKRKLEREIWETIQARTDLTASKPRPALFKDQRLRAAAAVFALVGLAVVLYLLAGTGRRGLPVTSPTAPVADDASPGGNKALLVLASGVKIVLDSLQNGPLDTVGNARVIKINSGKIAFRSREAHPSTRSAALSYNTLSTPRGGIYQITLPDGSDVWLNASSSLRFPTEFLGKERTVYLSGEAYFEVSPNKAQPFRVMAGGMEIRDVGTHFNVMAYHDEPDILTTLVEGAVKVKKDHRSVLLSPGQQSILAREGDGTIRVQKADTGETTAWKNGYFSFHSTSIYEIMRQISRWYDVDVNFRDSVPVYLNGNIDRSVNASQVLKMLELTGELRFSIRGKSVTVEKR